LDLLVTVGALLVTVKVLARVTDFRSEFVTVTLYEPMVASDGIARVPVILVEETTLIFCKGIVVAPRL
jgi:hypothetical protein